MPLPKDPKKREDYLRKQRESHIGLLAGENHPMYGRTGTLAPGYGRRGNAHPNWVGADIQNPYGREFTEDLKEEIRERDGNECVLCGAKVANKDSDKLHVHHIDFSKSNHSIDNLISLCTGCHNDAHKGVVAIYSPSDWEELLHN